MGRVCEGNETLQLALVWGFMPVVPPMSARVHPWAYDREMYQRRKEIERLFRRLKGFRRIFSRFENLDVIFPLRRLPPRQPQPPTRNNVPLHFAGASGDSV